MTNPEPDRRVLSHAELLELKRLNTPTIYNGWEQITPHDAALDGFNLEESRDFMPQMGPMVGYAVTVVCRAGLPHPRGRARPRRPAGAWPKRGVGTCGREGDGEQAAGRDCLPLKTYAFSRHTKSLDHYSRTGYLGGTGG